MKSMGRERNIFKHLGGRGETISKIMGYWLSWTEVLRSRWPVEVILNKIQDFMIHYGLQFPRVPTASNFPLHTTVH